MKTRMLTATIAAFIVGHGPLNAANFTWDGGALFSVNDWSAGLNWSTNIAPPSDGTADLFFAGSTRLNANADVAWNIKSLTFNAGAGQFEIQGSALTIGSGGVTNSGASEQDISNNIVLSVPQTFSTTSTGGLDLNGVVNNTGNLLTVDAGAGLIRFFGNVNGAGGLTKTGAGTVRLEGVASNIYVGTTTVNEGTLELAKAGGLIAVQGALNVSGGASVVLFGNNQIGNASAVSVTGFSVVNLNGFSDQIGSLSIASGTVQTGAGTLFLGGNVTAPVVNDSLIQGAVDLMGALRTFDVGNNVVLERDLSITATIANGAILKTGAGSLLLAGANTFAGGVTVSAGELNVGNNSAVGTGTLTLNTGGAIRSDKSTVTLANAVTIAGDADFTGIRDLIFSGATTLSGSRTLNVTNSAQTIFSGSFTPDTLLASVTKTGSGTLTFSGSIANTFVGPTIVKDGRLLLEKTAGVTAIPGALTVGDGTNVATVELKASDQIANTSSVFVNAGSRLELRNFSEQIGALTLNSGTVGAGIGTLTLGGNVNATATATASVIFADVNLGGATRIFTVGDGAAAVDLNAALTLSNGGLVKEGAGALSLGNSNNFADGLTINAGEVALGTDTSAGTGTLILNNGARIRSVEGPIVLANLLTIGGNITVSGAEDVAFSGATTLTGTRTITTTNTALTSLNGVIGQDAAGRGLVKAGLRTLSLGGTAANTFTGLTMVNEGTLLLAKTGGVNAVVGSTFIVGDGIGGSQADRVQLRAPNQIGNTTPVTVRSSGFLDLNNFDETIPSLGLEGGQASSGTGLLTVTGPIDALSSSNSALINGHLSLGGGVRTITVANGSGDFDLFISASIIDGSITKAGGGLLAITGPQSYSALLAQAGTTKLFTPLGSGTSTVNVTPTGASATVNFNTSQTLAALTIGNGGVVNLDNEPIPAAPLPFDELLDASALPVPEPGAASLIVTGVFSLLRRRPKW